jgi:hypothetical protein
MDQIREYNPPPNPAKFTDSRASSYVAEFGTKSWELDALSPQVIAGLITKNVLQLRDDSVYQVQKDREEKGKAQLEKISDNWEHVATFVEDQL